MTDQLVIDLIVLPIEQIIFYVVIQFVELFMSLNLIDRFAVVTDEEWIVFAEKVDEFIMGHQHCYRLDE